MIEAHGFLGGRGLANLWLHVQQLIILQFIRTGRAVKEAIRDGQQASI